MADALSYENNAADEVVQQDQERQQASRLRMEQSFARRDLAQQELKKAATEAVKKGGTKIMLRVLNFGSAATVYGLIITFFLMNSQLILGNLAGLPFFSEIKLEWWEIAFIIFIDFLILIALLLGLTILAAIANPLELAKQIASDFFRNLGCQLNLISDCSL